MSAAELLESLAERGVELWTEGDVLRFRAPKGAFTADLRGLVAERKQELLHLLRDPRSPAAGPSSGQDRDAGAAPAVVPDPAGRFEPFPMTDLQEAYWVGQSNAIELGGFTALGYVELEIREIDVARLECALDRLIARHDMLRAVVLEDGHLQVLRDVPPYRVGVLDLRGLDAQAVSTALEEIRRRALEQRIEPQSWPIFAINVSLHRDRALIHWGSPLLLGDDWSYHILLDELFRLYEDPEALLRPLGITFRDFVLGLERLRDSEPYRRSMAYWRERALSLPPAPELPQVRASGPSGFRRLSARSEPAWWERFCARARKAGVTPAMALCTAYSEVLASWSQHRRFTLNLLFFNRPPLHPQIDHVVGNFTSTILLEVDASGDRCFRERARDLQKRLLQDLEHSRVSGVQVLRELNRSRGGHARAAMPVVFAANMGAAATTGVAEPVPGRPRGIYGRLFTPQVLLDHQVHVLHGAVTFNWDVAAERFPEGMMDTLFGVYCAFLRRLADEEGSWEETGRNLTPEADLALQAAANATAHPFPDAVLHGLFEEQAARRPGHPAVIAEGRQLTYGELERRTRLLAHELRSLGAGANRLVGVVMHKGWEQVVATLAILRAGAAYLPVDPDLPAARVLSLLTRGEVEIVLTQEALLPGIACPAGVRTLAVDAPRWEPEAGVEPPALEPVRDPRSLAYVIFTSGSTGEPKGVVIDHRGAVNTILDLNDRFRMGPEDRVFALSSLSFDLSVYDIFGTLGAGGTVVIPSPGSAREPADWVDLLQRERVTVWNSVPALLQMLVDHLEAQEEPLPPALRLVMLSGDWIPVRLPNALRALGGNVEVISMGGATEASIWSILYPIGEVPPDWTSIPYGKALANQTFHVLDERLEPRPVWVPGNLYIGGIGLALGYWRDEEKTRAAFVRHPRTGERLYRTGDLGRFLPDGNIEFLGREDHQVKVQGYRIELGEIEAALADHPDLEAGVVLAVGETRGSKRLVGYAVPVPGRRPAAEELRDFLRGRLPEYMVPQTIALLASLPLTANGKVDRGALTAAGAGAEESGAPCVPPRTPLEGRLCALWEEVLGVRPVGVTQDFFRLGGHSLLAMRLVARIRKEIGRDLRLSALLERPTVERVAELLEQRSEDAAHSPLITVRGGGEESPLFCVHPVGGSVMCYVGLAGHLDPGRPVLGLERAEAGEESLEEMAARYAAAIRAQHSGPWHLSGWSMGGVVAYEMARQLAARGEEVALVALIDPPAPRRPGTPPDDLDEVSLVAWYARDLAGIFGDGVGLPAEELALLPAGERLRRLHGWAVGRGMLSPDLELKDLEHLFAVFRSNAHTLAAYTPGPYAGPIVLFEAADVPKSLRDERAAVWGRLSQGGVERIAVPGDHFRVLGEPGVRIVAERLGSLVAAGGLHG